MTIKDFEKEYKADTRILNIGDAERKSPSK